MLEVLQLLLVVATLGCLLAFTVLAFLGGWD